MNTLRLSTLTLCAFLLLYHLAYSAATDTPTVPVFADPFTPNYDEEKAGDFQLPDLLTASNGNAITTAEQWREQRRPELLELFREEMFGHNMAPRRILTVQDRGQFDILDGLGRVTQIALHYGPQEDQVAQLSVSIFLYQFRGTSINGYCSSHFSSTGKIGTRRLIFPSILPPEITRCFSRM